MSFHSLGLSEPLLRAINDSNYTNPTPIQTQAIPAILSGRDLMAAAQTGTGKTAGFGLPLLERLSRGDKAKANQVRALILTPTRELAVQVEQNISSYAKYLRMRTYAVYGGVKINPQMQRLRGGSDILVATPGRLLDLAGQHAVKFDHLEALVLDEADRMLDMGFRNDLNKILALLPVKRQNLLFSATFSDSILNFTRGLLNQPLQIEVSPRNATANTVKQRVFEVDKSKKAALLCQLAERLQWQQVLVFNKTKRGADQLVRQLKKAELSAVAIHGDKAQGVRNRALADFKAGKVRILVATDIAARGIDITGLPQVVNYNLPQVPEDYVHRIGRTGRAGLEGEAISLVCADDAKLLAAIEKVIKKTLPREVEAGFIPTHNVPSGRPESKAPQRSKKPKAGQQTKTGQRNPGEGKELQVVKRSSDKRQEPAQGQKQAPANRSQRRERSRASSSKQQSGQRQKS